KTAYAPDQRNGGPEIGRSEAAARGPGGPGVGQIGDRGLAHGTRAGTTEAESPAAGRRRTGRRRGVRRAVRAPESERQHEFVMLRARLAYTIARHGLRSLDQLEKLLLQVTRKNDIRGYERFKDLFEAIVAYNE